MSASKKILSVFLAITTFLIALPISNIYSFASDSSDFSYSVISETDKTAELTGYSGEGGDVVIPSAIDGYTVKSIGDSAFEEAYSIVSLTVPETIEEISTGALIGCPSVTSINVSQNNQYFSSENGVLFDKDKSQLLRYPAAKEDLSYTVPSSVLSIGPMAFAICQNLTSIIMPDNLQAIVDYAFAYCPMLQSIELPDTLTYLGSYAFTNCTSLESVTLSENIDSIPENTFEECSALQSVDIPQSVTSIGDYAFMNCSALQSITGMEGVVSIGERAFVYCSALNSIVLPNTLTNLGSVAFAACSSLESINIPLSLSTISDYSFQMCSSLSSIEISEGVTTIGNGAFLNTNLSSVLIPASVVSISEDAFGNTPLNEIYGYENTYAQSFANDKGYTFIELADPNALPGDLNGDKALDERDVNILMSAALGVVTLKSSMVAVADINEDGIIDGFDVAALDRLISSQTQE